MNPFRWLLLILAGLTCLVDVNLADAQVRSNRLQSIITIQDTKIGEQRVQRQTEVLRLETLIDDFTDRVTRLERHMLSMSRLPSITIAEAEAQMAFAKAQLKETEKLFADGQSSEVDVARDRLALVRARGQLDSAQAAHEESKIIMELDVAFAKRRLLRASNEKEQMERLVAKGYTSSAGLRYQLIDVDLAERQLQLALLRLNAFRQSAGEPEEPPVSQASPPSDAAPPTTVDGTVGPQG